MSRLVLPMVLLTAVFAIGIAWYALVEDFTFIEALYQSVTTLSTVGFSEVNPLDTSGRIFTIVFILSGLGLMFYTATAIVEVVIAGELRTLLGRQRSGRRVRRMERHVIVCGFGRVGQEIAADLILMESLSAKELNHQDRHEKEDLENLDSLSSDQDPPSLPDPTRKVSKKRTVACW